MEGHLVVPIYIIIAFTLNSSSYFFFASVYVFVCLKKSQYCASSRYFILFVVVGINRFLSAERGKRGTLSHKKVMFARLE